MALPDNVNKTAIVHSLHSVIRQGVTCHDHEGCNCPSIALCFPPWRYPTISPSLQLYIHRTWLLSNALPHNIIKTAIVHSLHLVTLHGGIKQYRCKCPCIALGYTPWRYLTIPPRLQLYIHCTWYSPWGYLTSPCVCSATEMLNIKHPYQLHPYETRLLPFKRKQRVRLRVEFLNSYGRIYWSSYTFL